MERITAGYIAHAYYKYLKHNGHYPRSMTELAKSGLLGKGGFGLRRGDEFSVQPVEKNGSLFFIMSFKDTGETVQVPKGQNW